MQLDLHKKNYRIIFYDKTNITVSEKTYAQIMAGKKQDPKGGFSLPDGSFYAYNVISKILTNEDFYKQYPFEREQEVEASLYKESLVKQEKRDDYQIPVKWSKEKRLTAMGQLLKGLKKYQSEHTFSPNTDDLVEKSEIRLKDIENDRTELLRV